jgi:hypothetical protein
LGSTLSYLASSVKESARADTRPHLPPIEDVLRDDDVEAKASKWAPSASGSVLRQS